MQELVLCLGDNLILLLLLNKFLDLLWLLLEVIEDLRQTLTLSPGKILLAPAPRTYTSSTNGHHCVSTLHTII